MKRAIPAPEGFVETGAVQFGNNVPGVYISGKDALHHAMAIENAIELRDPISITKIRKFIDTLRSCTEKPTVEVGRAGHLTDEMIARFWPGVVAEQDKAELRREWAIITGQASKQGETA